VKANLHEATNAVHSLPANDCDHWTMMAGQWTGNRFFVQSAGQAGQQIRRREYGLPRLDAGEPDKEHG
jgi:hypothetical protein